MEGKSTPDMISMSRPSRDNRASKNPKATTDIANPGPLSKKSQIRASGNGTSPRVIATPASKKAKTGVEKTKAGEASSVVSKKSDTTGSGRTIDRSRSSKRAAAENGSDVTLEVLRPAKKRKISKESGATVTPSSPVPSPVDAESLKSDVENGKYIPTAAVPTTTGETPLPDYAVRNPKSGVAASADVTTSTGQSVEEIQVGEGSAAPHQIDSRPTRIAGNGLTGAAAEKRKKELRALRPRPQPTAPKVKKRTRFHEITLGEGDGPRIVGRRIKVFWPLENRFFYGHVKAFNGTRKLQHKIVYDDKDEEWLRLQNEVFGIELEPGEVFGGPAALSSATAETDADGEQNDFDNSNERKGVVATAVDDGGTANKAVETTTTGEGRIKPEGVYRRKRKDERANDEKTAQLSSDGAAIEQHEKSGEGGDRNNAKKSGRGGNGGEDKKGKGGGDKDKTTGTGKGDGEDKKREGDSDAKKKTEGASSERKKRLEGTGIIRRKGEGSNKKQRGSLAERFGRVKANRSSGNSTVSREHGKRGVFLVTPRDRRNKAIVQGSSRRRKKAGGEEKARNKVSSSVQIRTRQSNSADQDSGQKTLRSRIRDDDRLFPTVKSPSAVIKHRLVPPVGNKRANKEPKTPPRSSSEVKQHSGQIQQIQREIAAGEGDKLISSFAVNVREPKQIEEAFSLPRQEGADAPLGPFEAVMDAYREALSGTRNVPSSSSPVNRAAEQHSVETVREDEGATLKTGSLGVHNDKEFVSVGEDLDPTGRLTSGGASPARPHVTSRIGNELTESLLVHEDDHRRAGNEAESDFVAGIGGELKEEEGGQRWSGGEVSTTEVVVLTPLITPVTDLRPELKEPPDKVYRRVKKYQPDKVYSRLKHSRNKKAHNSGVDDSADVSQIVVPAPQYWVLARDLPSASHVLCYGARIAALGSSPHSFDRTAFSRPQCWSSVEDSRLQLGTFYGAPSMQSLLRVSWKSLRWLFALVLVTVNEVEDNTSSVESSLCVRKIRKCNLLPLSGAANNRFKRRGMSRSNVIRSVTSSLRQLLDPASDLKWLSQSTVFFRGLGMRSRRLGSILKHSSVLPGVPPLATVPQDSQLGLVMRSPILIPPKGQRDDHQLWTGQLVSRSDALIPPTTVLDGKALEFISRSSSGVPVTPARVHDTTGMEVGAYYGRPTLESFLVVTRDETYRMDLRSLSTQRSDDGADSVDLKIFLRAVSDLQSVGSGGGNDAESISRVGLNSAGLREESGRAVGHESFHAIPFKGSWVIDAASFNFEDCTLDLTLPRYAAAIPRSVVLGKESLLNTRSALGFCRNSMYSLHQVLLDGMDIARPQDLVINGLQVGTYLGPPSVVSMLRAAADFWSQLLAVQRKAHQRVNDISVSSPVLKKGGSESLLQPQSSTDIVCDREVSYQEPKTHDISGAGSGLEPSVVGDDLGSVKSSDKSLGLTTKGRRTGKGPKRGLTQTVGDSLENEGLGVDTFADGDALNGRPYSKRTRLEIENSGAATTRDSGLETSHPSSNLEGKSSIITPLPTQEKPVDPPVPRVNVLKLRRCPTNKGVWLVAGNSCGPPQDTGLRGATAEAEPRVPSDSREIGVRVDPMTPVFETTRKRGHQYLDSPSHGRSNLSRHPTVATVSSADSQEPEMNGSGVKSTKSFSRNTSSQDMWFDYGIESVNGGIADGMETRKRRRKGSSPNAVDDVDGISERSLRRSADPGWGSCTANVLITKSDRCIRETGATVELQLRHGNIYMLTVSIRGENQYALKADQPVATGTTNKFTHSMMWRGGKAWSLEFVDRKQWQLFKDLHEECFQRNARAASVRHIPIPGVKPIQECAHSGPRYVRPSLKYIRQYEGEAEVAFASRIVYDMDSEDEEWLNQVNSEKLSARGTRSRAKVDEDTLEKVIDKLEKTSFIRHQDAMSAEVVAELCQGLGSQEAVKAIHSYWSEKRRRKGMSLVRYFQPAPWEQYQKQLQEWQEKVDQLQQKSPTATKQQLQSLCKRPPLFAFCLRPRGLETRNKMQKQRSHKKQGLNGSSSRQWTPSGTPNDFFWDSPSKRQPSVDSTGGPFHGTRKYTRQRSQEGSFSDPMAVDLTESFNAIAAEGFTSMGDGGQAVSEGTPVFPRVETSSVQFDPSASGGLTKRTKKLGRKAKKMRLLAAAEESRRKRLLRAQQAHPNGRFTETRLSPSSLSELSPVPAGADPSSSGVPLPQKVGPDEGKVAIALAAEAFAKAKREAAMTLRSRAQALHAIADAAMHKAVAAVVAADAIHAAERANEGSSGRHKAHSVGNHRPQSGDVPVGAKDDLSWSWGRSDASSGASFGSWRRALNSASRNANHILSKGGSSKPGSMTDVDDALLPVASWSQELGAGLGTRLLQKGDVSPQRQRYSPILVEGVSKSPAKGVRGEGLVSLGRTRGESMMAMLTR
ncbi:unnamed protein product [Calypogeia fissa]